MKELANSPAPENFVRTSFFSTPLISPSSLAFFISGFEKTTRETRNDRIKHTVAVRETEKDYQERLFAMTDQILEAVESFMNLQLPIENLHSIALPNFGFEIGSFFGFNLFR